MSNALAARSPEFSTPYIRGWMQLLLAGFAIARVAQDLRCGRRPVGADLRLAGLPVPFGR